MARRNALTAIVSLVLCSLASNGVFAQYYYYQPQYYQPMGMWGYPMDYWAPMDADVQSSSSATPPSRSQRRPPPQPIENQQIGLHGGSFLGASRPCDAPCDAAPGRLVRFSEPLPMPKASLPDCCDGAIHVLDYPGILTHPDCCPDCTTGNCDHDIRRFPSKEAALKAGCDPECLVCVKEPFLCTTEVFETAEVVFFRCFERTTAFKDKRCEDQRCILEVGKRTVKKLEPCTVKIKFPYKKTVIEYRDVWICIKCECSI